MSSRSVRSLSSVLGSVFAVAACIAASAAQPEIPNAMLAGLQWRLVGPFRGGWGTMAVGIPDQPQYVLLRRGWRRRLEDRRVPARRGNRCPTASSDAAIGAIAIAPIESESALRRHRPSRAALRHRVRRRPIQIDRRRRALAERRTQNDAPHRRDPCRSARRKHRCSSARSATSSARVRIAACSARPTAARRGRKRSSSITRPASSISPPILRDPNIVFASAWTARNWPWLSYFTPIEGEGSAIWNRRRRSDLETSQRRRTGRKENSAASDIAVAHLSRDATRIYAVDRFRRPRRPLSLRRRRRALANRQRRERRQHLVHEPAHRRAERSRHGLHGRPVDPQIDRRRQDLHDHQRRARRRRLSLLLDQSRTRRTI